MIDCVERDIDQGDFTSYMPNGDKVKYQGQWLNDRGCSEANALSIALPKFIKQQQYAPVTKVMTRNPNTNPQWDAYIQTSNPIRTVYSFILNCDIKDVQLYRDIPTADTNDYDTSGSLLICGNAYDMNFNDKRGDAHIPRPGSILGELRAKFNIHNQAVNTIMTPAKKGSSIYVFSQGSIEHYHLDVESQSILPGFGPR
jgi:hypothetical protein